MFLDESAAAALLSRALSLSKAQGCAVSLTGGEEQSLRFARGTATTNIAGSDATLRISSHIDDAIGSASTSSLDDASISAAVARSEEIARLLPPDPDYVAPLGPQNYAASRRYDEATGLLRLDALAQAAGEAIDEGARRGVDTFGFAASRRRFDAMATSAGLFGYDRASEIDFAVTARTKGDTWSGWASASHIAAADLDAAAVARRACAKAAQDAAPVDLDPGNYTVLLEPAASAELLRYVMTALDARAMDEGRSFYAGKSGAMFDGKLSLLSGPDDALAPEGAIGWEGVPHRPRAWISGGQAESFYRSRAYAQKSGGDVVPFPRHFSAAGGATPVDEMIRSVTRGVLVTRFWYSNMVDPRSLLVTGLTRDGNFLIENGRIVAPVKNMRFNQSLGAAFANIAALGSSERVKPDSSASAVGAPAMLLENFCFSSRSSGI